MLTNEQVQEKLQKSVAPRVTTDYIQSRIEHIEFSRISQTVTICNITLDNQYSVRGESACVYPENYDKEIGEQISYDSAFNKLWPLFGFLLAEQRYVSVIASE